MKSTNLWIVRRTKNRFGRRWKDYDEYLDEYDKLIILYFKNEIS